MKRIFLDTETTGLSRYRNRICSLTIVDDCDEACTFMFDPEQPVEPGATAVNGYTWQMLRKYPTFASQARQIKALLDSADVIVAHNASFDIGFIKMEFARCGIIWQPRCVECTLQKAKRTISSPCYKLEYLTNMLGLKNLRGRYHGSLEDTVMCKALYHELNSYTSGVRKRYSYTNNTNSSYINNYKPTHANNYSSARPVNNESVSIGSVWLWGGAILFLMICAL